MRRLCFFVCLLAWILAFCPLVYADIPEPNLVEPYDGASVSTEALFKWEAVSGAISYTLQIFDWFDQTESNEYTTTQNQYQLPSSTLSESTPYYWQVKVSDASGENAWSPTWGFRTLPDAIDPFQMEEDSDHDGIPDTIEKEILHTNVEKKTLFVRPKKKIGPDTFEYWDDFISLFPGSLQGRANIKPFTDAGIEVVVIGDPNNPYKRMRKFDYNPADDPNEPFCTIMEVMLERYSDANGDPVTFPDAYKGHTYLLHGYRGFYPYGKVVHVWSWSRPAYTNSNPTEDEYNLPRFYPYPLDRYIDEGAYANIDVVQTLATDSPATTDCSDSPEKCNKASPMNLPDINPIPPFTRSQDETVEFNAITFDEDGKIEKIDEDQRGIQNSRDKVLAKLVVHEMGHGLLSAVEEEHCENPCCIMYKRMRDWEQLLFGPFCAAGRADNCSQVCQHSPGGSQDIRHHGVVYNIQQSP